jgi:tetratricopeptide (TPR) repeat protein
LRGRIEDSLRQVQSARELDPLSLANTSTAAFFAYYNARDYDKAVEVCHEALDLDPAFLPARWQLVAVYEQTGELGKAIEEQRAETRATEDRRFAQEVNLLSKAYAEKGARGYWVQKLKLFRADAYPKDSIYVARVYARLGNKDEAFRWLDTALKNHLPYLIWVLPANPDLDGLRSDPRFTDLLRRLGPGFGSARAISLPESDNSR